MEYETGFYSWRVGENAFDAEESPESKYYVIRFYEVDEKTGVVREGTAHAMPVDFSDKPRYPSYARVEDIPGFIPVSQLQDCEQLTSNMTKFNPKYTHDNYYIDFNNRKAYSVYSIEMGIEMNVAGVVPKSGYLYCVERYRFTNRSRFVVYREVDFDEVYEYYIAEQQPVFKPIPREGMLALADAVSLGSCSTPIRIMYVDPRTKYGKKVYSVKLWESTFEGSDTKPPVPFSEIYDVWELECGLYYADEYSLLNTDIGWVVVHVVGYPEGYAAEVYVLEGETLYKVVPRLERQYDPEVGVIIRRVGEQKIPANIAEPEVVRAMRIIEEVLKKEGGHEAGSSE